MKILTAAKPGYRAHNFLHCVFAGIKSSGLDIMHIHSACGTPMEMLILPDAQGREAKWRHRGWNNEQSGGLENHRAD